MHLVAGKMKSIGKVASNDTSNIGMLPSALRYVSLKFTDQFIHIINNPSVSAKFIAL